MTSWMTFKMLPSKDLLRVILCFLMLRDGTRSAVQETALSPMIFRFSVCSESLNFIPYRISIWIDNEDWPSSTRSHEVSWRVCWPLHWVLLQDQTSSGSHEARMTSMSDAIKSAMMKMFVYPGIWCWLSYCQFMTFIFACDLPHEYIQSTDIDLQKAWL